MPSRQKTVGLVLLLVGGIALIWASGMAFWLALGLVAIGALAVFMPGGGDRTGRFARLAMITGSVFVCLMLIEAMLWVLERSSAQPLPTFTAQSDVPQPPALPPEIEAKIELMQAALVMPAAWEKRDTAKVPGTDPFVWHGAFHPIDADGMRREEPFPPKDPKRFRIMVVGDSLTYGEGIEEFWTYAAQLERALAADVPVEVLNLGVRGYASQDILEVVRRFVPELQPDLVVYGVCLNDFLESGGLQAGPPQLLPRPVSKLLTRRTRVARLMDERVSALMRRVGAAPDFYSELLMDLTQRRERFGRDVAAMNSFVTESGLPPMIAIVLDQAPRLDGPGRQLALIAEEELGHAGIQIVPSEPFYRRHDGRNLRVSRWEGHPNEEANAIWASMLAEAIREHSDLLRFRTARDLDGGAPS